MKIVILNDSFYSETHLDRLRTLGELAVFDGTSSTAEAIKRTGDAEIVLGDQYLVDFNAEYFANVPNVKTLALNTTAFNRVDLTGAAEKGIKVTNTPGYSRRSVAELAIGLVFSAVRRISYGERRNQENPAEPDPASPEGKALIGYNLENKTLGVVGVGGIGTEVAKIAQGIGMNVIGWNRTHRDTISIKLVELEELMRTSDVVVVTLAYSDELKGLLSRDMLQKLKPTSVLVNMGEAGFIDMEALYELLRDRRIHGAAFDLAKFESNDPILALDNFIKTPHIGSYSAESFYENLPTMIVENVEAFVAGNPKHVVN